MSVRSRNRRLSTAFPARGFAAKWSRRVMSSGDIYVGAAGRANPPAEREHRAEEHSHLEHYAHYFDAVETTTMTMVFKVSERTATRCFSSLAVDGVGLLVGA